MRKSVVYDAVVDATNQAIREVTEGDPRALLNLPDLTQEPLINVNATPDEEYPLRILRAYLTNSQCRYTDGTGDGTSDNELSPVFKAMNGHAAERTKLLEKAIEVLTTHG